MEFSEVIKNRHSVRSFSSKEVEEEKLKEILDLVQTAPSAGNLKSYRVIVVKDKEKKEKLVDASFGKKFIAEVPVVLVFIADKDRSSLRYGERGATLYSVQDATIAASYAQLAAVNLGLSTVWVGAFSPEEVSRIIKIKERELPVAMLPLGYEK